MERALPLTGWLAARESTLVSVKVAGRLKTFAVDLGDRVEPGQILGQVEPRDYELRLQQALAALAQARATLGLPLEGDDDTVALEQTPGVRQAQARLEEASRNLERVRNLSRDGISSAAELDTAEAAHKVAREQYEAALHEAHTRRAALAQRRAEYNLAQQQLADTAVRAPFAGAVQARLAALGEYMVTGSPLVVLVQVDPLRLRLEVAERDAARVRPGQVVRASIEGVSSVPEGRVCRVSPALNETNRMLVVEVDLPNPGHLRPGLFARAQLVLEANDPALAVPANALLVFAGIEKVVTFDQGKALEKPIVTGRRTTDWIEVLKGLEEGEAVVLDPGGIRTGQAIQPTERHADTR